MAQPPRESESISLTRDAIVQFRCHKGSQVPSARKWLISRKMQAASSNEPAARFLFSWWFSSDGGGFQPPAVSATNPSLGDRERPFVTVDNARRCEKGLRHVPPD